MDNFDEQGQQHRQEESLPPHLEMQPISGPPTLHTINGCGTFVYGQRDYDSQTGSYVKTLCIVVLFVPILALRAYRVVNAQSGWYFLGRVPLSGLARAWNFFMLAGVPTIVVL